MADRPIPVLPPEEAIAFFSKKGLARSFAWQDIWQSQNDYYFTVAKMLEVSLLEEVHGLIAEALSDGRSPQQLGKELKGLLRDRGWWGRQLQTDPLTQETKPVMLGSNRRVRTIVDTNLRTSYSAGRFARQERVKEALPILVYKSRLDGRERPQHRAWHNTALPQSHPWWQNHYPPCDWGCRCRTVSMTIKMAERRGLKIGELPANFGTRQWLNKRTGEIIEIEKGIGAGWDYHPGRAPIEGLAPEPLFGFSRTGDGEAIAAAQPSAPARFLQRFGLDAGGGVWRDATGWPLALSRAWLSGLSQSDQAKAVAASLAIASPDEIRAVWVTGKDSRAMLMRRYLVRGDAMGFVVDVGSSFWRFVRVNRARLDRLAAAGVSIWTRESEAEASYDPHQARDRNGKWTSSGQQAVDLANRVWAGEPVQATIRLAPLSTKSRSRLTALKVRDDAKSVAVDTDAMRHIKRRHGNDNRGQKGIEPEDFRHVAAIFNKGTINHGTPRIHSERKTPMLYVSHSINDTHYVAAFEVRKHRIHLWSLRKR